MATLTKDKVYSACRAWIQNQISELKSALEGVKESIANEDKSSAGDKFETARAMAQKEMELLGQQLQKALNDQKLLLSIDGDKELDHVQLGSLVKTEDKYLYIAVAIGKINVEGEDVFIISASSPMGQTILGKAAGFQFSMANKEQSLLWVK